MSSVTCGGEVGLDFAEEMGGAVGGLDFAAHVERDPFGAGGDDADIVLPGLGIERVLHHFGRGAGGQGEVEVAEGALADGLNDLLRIGLAGEDDLGFGTDGANAAEELERVEAVAAGPGEDHVDGSGADAVEGLAAVRYLLDLPVIPFEEAGKVFLDGGIGIEKQQAAGDQKFSTL